MASEWKTELLGNLCLMKNGYAFKSKDFVSQGIPVIKIKNVKPNRILTDDLSYVPADVAEQHKRWSIEKGEILLTMTGNRADGSPESWVGKAAIFNENTPYLLNQRVSALKTKDETTIDTNYLGYYLSSWQTQLYFIKRANSSGGQANISPEIVMNMPVQYPPLATQKKIVCILGTLDQKIKTNAAINDNLRQQAQAIYASLFIENADLAWEQGHLSDLITVKYGKDHKKLADGSYPVYGSGGIMRYVERPLYDKESVLIPRKGTLNNVIYVNQPFWSVDTMFYTEMRLPNVAKFVFHFVKSKDLASMNAGSAVPSMTTDILNAMEVIIPSASALKEFEALVSPMYITMQENDNQSKMLAELRDTLLPKLMSGEIDVSDIQL